MGVDSSYQGVTSSMGLWNLGWELAGWVLFD